MEIPGYSQLTRAYNKLSPFELVVFAVLAILLTVSGVGLLMQFQNRVSTDTPASGGHYREGIVGFPQYINPVLAQSDADRDLSALIYAGLTKLTTESEIELDLAESMQISEGGQNYTFTLRDDIYFHDGQPITADDVAFTINLVQNPVNNSPRQADWNSISVDVIDEKTITFNLSQPFTDFPHIARIGIIPQHLWEEKSFDSLPFLGLNTNPVGSGPYEVTNIRRNDQGIPSEYTLSAANTYPETPYIERITLTFFSNAAELLEAFNDGDISGFHSGNHEDVKDIGNDSNVMSQQLNRVFGIYFNQNNNDALVSSEVRQALSSVIPRADIVSSVLHGYGQPIDGPLPNRSQTDGNVSSLTIATAMETLNAAGWVSEEERLVNDDGQTLSIELATVDIPELTETAQQVARSWEDLGISVTVTALPLSELSQNIVRPRNYEALLFGQVINQSQDLYPFWHSGGQDDPGLNLAMYANSSVDTALSDWRTATSSEERNEHQETILQAIAEESPAAFIYSSAFIYVLPDEIKSMPMPSITAPADRFSRIEDWYIDTEKLWNIFIKNEDENRPSK